VQKAIAPRLVMFTVASESRSASPFGAFVNRNHMAAWLLLVAMPVAGYLIAQLRIHSDARARFWVKWRAFLVSGAALTAIALTLIVGILLLTLSRSGLIGLATAGLVGWFLGRSRLTFNRTSLPVLVSTFGVALLVATLFIDTAGWAARVQQSIDFTPGETDRVQIWKESMPIVKDFWLTGSGAGTFSTVMTQYQQTRLWVGSMRRWAHFNNAHSHPVQLLAEGGLLLTLPVLWAIAAFVGLAREALHADKGEMFWVRAGAAAALAGLAAQSIWETSLIMPPNAVMTGVAAGLVLYRRSV
jgi:O-antigen ligase